MAVSIENSDEVPVSETVSLSVGGSEQDSITVELDGGENTTVTLTWDSSNWGPGEYEAVVSSANDSVRRMVTVEEPNSAPSVGVLGFIPCDRDCDGDPVFASANDSEMATEELTIAYDRFKRTTLRAPNTTDPDGEIAAYEWTVDGEVVSSSRTLSYTFSDPGAHEIRLRVTDDGGAQATTAENVSVSDALDIDLGFERPAVSEDLNFSASVGEPEAVESYEWTVDGEVVGSGSQLRYSFDDPGEHEVALRIVAGDRRETTSRTTVVVEETDGETGGSTDTTVADADSEDSGFGDPVLFGVPAGLVVVALLGYVYLNGGGSAGGAGSAAVDSGGDRDDDDYNETETIIDPEPGGASDSGSGGGDDLPGADSDGGTTESADDLHSGEA